MLVINRKPNQSFTIGDDITVTVGKFRGNQVRLIIDAPDNVSIKRDNMTKDIDNNSKNITRAQAIKWGLLL